MHCNTHESWRSQSYSTLSHSLCIHTVSRIYLQTILKVGIEKAKKKATGFYGSSNVKTIGAIIPVQEHKVQERHFRVVRLSRRYFVLRLEFFEGQENSYFFFLYFFILQRFSVHLFTGSGFKSNTVLCVCLIPKGPPLWDLLRIFRIGIRDIYLSRVSEGGVVNYPPWWQNWDCRWWVGVVGVIGVSGVSGVMGLPGLSLPALPAPW